MATVSQFNFASIPTTVSGINCDTVDYVQRFSPIVLMWVIQIRFWLVTQEKAELIYIKQRREDGSLDLFLVFYDETGQQVMDVALRCVNKTIRDVEFCGNEAKFD
uniref:DUF3388 domain-containing protein n=1 Tax=Caenorhabditis tropicalis TaxID=1561998 RepID=A0A1I7V0U1_9PELO